MSSGQTGTVPTRIGIEAIVRSRPARIALVVGLLATGAWAFAPNVLNDVSTEASVNAPLIRLTAPSDGTVRPLPAIGTFFEQPVRLGLVIPSPDTGALADLRSEADIARAAEQLARRQLDEIKTEQARLRVRSDVFSHAAVERSAADLAAANAEEASCKAIRAEAGLALVRAERLATSGFVSAAGLEKARSAAAVSESSCAAAIARVHALAVEAASARRGVFLAADSYNDAPYSRQQLDRLLLQRQLIEAEATSAAERAAAATRRLRAAEARLSYRVPAGALVWSALASEGATIRAGEPIIDLVDCRRRFLEVSLAEANASVIDQSEPVRIRLMGSDQWLSGRVLRIKGAAARRNDPLLASSQPHREDALTVEVSLPPAAGSVGTRRCDIGRTAEVRFSRLG